MPENQVSQDVQDQVVQLTPEKIQETYDKVVSMIANLKQYKAECLERIKQVEIEIGDNQVKIVTTEDHDTRHMLKINNIQNNKIIDEMNNESKKAEDDVMQLEIDLQTFEDLIKAKSEEVYEAVKHIFIYNK